MRYAFVVAASENYIPGLSAMLNSIELLKINPTPIAHILSFKLPFDYLNTLKNYKNVTCFYTESLKDHQVRGTAIERFKYASQLINNYDSICLLDADMFLTSDPTIFFEVASKGFIVTGSNGMIINFNKDYQKQYDTYLDKSSYPYPEIHTSVPIFINMDNIDWFDELYIKSKNPYWDDFLFLNLLGIKMGKNKKMICMPPYTFTGIHHWQMKPATAVFEREGILLSGTEERVYMVHGKWWDEGWLRDLKPTMMKYLKDEQIGSKGEHIVDRTIGLLKKKFNEFIQRSI